MQEQWCLPVHIIFQPIGGLEEFNIWRTWKCPAHLSSLWKSGQVRGTIDLKSRQMSGLSDEVRKNFTIMKDLSEHTRIYPDGQYKSGHLSQGNEFDME